MFFLVMTQAIKQELIPMGSFDPALINNTALSQNKQLCSIETDRQGKHQKCFMKQIFYYQKRELKHFFIPQIGN